jgi:hypothetical protein
VTIRDDHGHAHDHGQPHVHGHDETLEDLQRDGLRLIQLRDGFRFGEDSVLLAAYAAKLVRSRRHLQVADLGAGCGAVSILLASRPQQPGRSPSSRSGRYLPSG